MIVAVIPVKRLSEAKSRLSSRLTSQERATLVETLLRRTVGVLKEVRRGTHRSGDRRASIGRIARCGGLVAGPGRTQSITGPRCLLGDRSGGPIDAGGAMRSYRSCIRATSVCLLEANRSEPSMAIAATQDGGTGAILLSPPGALPPVFGPESFRRHQEEAHARGIPVVHRVPAWILARAGYHGRSGVSRRICGGFPLPHTIKKARQAQICAIAGQDFKSGSTSRRISKPRGRVHTSGQLYCPAMVALGSSRSSFWFCRGRSSRCRTWSWCCSSLVTNRSSFWFCRGRSSRCRTWSWCCSSW